MIIFLCEILSLRFFLFVSIILGWTVFSFTGILHDIMTSSDRTPKIVFVIRYITLFFLLNFWWQRYRDSTSEGVYDLRIFVPEFPIIPQESSSSSDEYSKTGRNPTNNPTHDLFLIVILADTENKKSSEILEFQSFALIYYLLSRCVRDSNPWPHAWQACILTNWTNAPLFHSFVAISLDCGCKGRQNSYICNSLKEKNHLFFNIAWL